jgi:hypothetical protein
MESLGVALEHSNHERAASQRAGQQIKETERTGSMIINKNNISKITVAAAIMLSMLVQTSPARGAYGPLVEVPFTKWITTLPQMAGVLGGDVAGDFRGEVLELTPPDPLPANNDIRQIEARYDIIADDPDQSFSAIIQGHQNINARTGVLNGVITDGWRLGAQVHVEFDIVAGPVGPCPNRTCFVGTIRVMPN